MVDSALYSSDKVEYGTPDWVKDPIIAALGLNFDVAASHENHVLPRYATKDGVFVKNFSSPSTPSGWRQYKDGLDFPWYGARVWCNPPYGSGRRTAPLAAFQLAHRLIKRMPVSRDFDRDTSITGDTLICGCKLQRESSFSGLNPQVGKQGRKNHNRIISASNPRPRHLLIELSRLLTVYGASPHGLRQELYDRLVSHLDLETQSVVGRALLGPGGWGLELLVDMYTAFTVHNTGNVGKDIFGNCLLHTHIIPWLVDSVGHYLGQVESSIETWVRKAALSTQVHRDFETGQQEVCEVAALLLPARTETEWFQRWVFPYAEVHFLMSRIKFIGGATSAPFPSVIAVYSPDIVVPPGRALARTLDLKSSGEFTSSILESKSRENRVTVHHRSRGTTTRESFR